MMARQESVGVLIVVAGIFLVVERILEMGLSVSRRWGGGPGEAGEIMDARDSKTAGDVDGDVA
jgi:hypothetical protein